MQLNFTDSLFECLRHRYPIGIGTLELRFDQEAEIKRFQYEMIKAGSAMGMMRSFYLQIQYCSRISTIALSHFVILRI